MAIIPAIIPTIDELNYCKTIFDEIIKIKQSSNENIEKLYLLENSLDDFVNQLYAIDIINNNV